jgi:hypothetical protein
MSAQYKRIGGIENYYGGLWLKKDEDLIYWSIENYDGHGWEEIPESLYLALLEFEKAPRTPLTYAEEDCK